VLFRVTILKLVAHHNKSVKRFNWLFLRQEIEDNDWSGYYPEVVAHAEKIINTEPYSDSLTEVVMVSMP